MSGREEDSDTSSELFLSSRRRRLGVLRLSSLEDDNSLDQGMEIDNDSSAMNTNETSDQNECFSPKGNQPNVRPFTSACGAKKTNEKVWNCRKIEDFYSLFVTDQMFEQVSEQTNIYAAQSRIASKRSNKWIPTNKNEIKRLFGQFIWMGMVPLSSSRLYWTRDLLSAQTFPQKVMSRDRFEILMRILHFANNRVNDASDRL